MPRACTTSVLVKVVGYNAWWTNAKSKLSRIKKIKGAHQVIAFEILCQVDGNFSNKKSKKIARTKGFSIERSTIHIKFFTASRHHNPDRSNIKREHFANIGTYLKSDLDLYYKSACHKVYKSEVSLRLLSMSYLSEKELFFSGHDMQYFVFHCVWNIYIESLREAFGLFARP